MIMVCDVGDYLQLHKAGCIALCMCDIILLL
jgi:hypothetical protein